jgi:hypothetical protein
MTIFQSKMDFLSANSRFGDLNDGTYLPQITRETCITEHRNLSRVLVRDTNNYFSVIFDHSRASDIFEAAVTVTKDWIDPKFNLFSNLRLFESLTSITFNANFCHAATSVESLKNHIEIYFCFR